MKKLILSAAAVLVFGFTNAQDMKFGVKGGLNFANVSGEGNFKNKIGFNVGAFAEIGVSDSFAVQPELLFSTQGANASEGDGSFNLNYINIPVMAKFKVAEGFSLQAGPQFGLLMTATAKGGGESLDIKEGFKTLDLGLNFGAGYDINENIMVDLRYNLGLGGLVKDLPSGATDSNNRVIALSIGYKF